MFALICFFTFVFFCVLVLFLCFYNAFIYCYVLKIVHIRLLYANKYFLVTYLKIR